MVTWSPKEVLGGTVLGGEGAASVGGKQAAGGDGDSPLARVAGRYKCDCDGEQHRRLPPRIQQNQHPGLFGLGVGAPSSSTRVSPQGNVRPFGASRSGYHVLGDGRRDRL